MPNSSTSPVSLAKPMPSSPATTPCPECGGVGFVRREVPPGHPDFGRAIPCHCRVALLRERTRQRLLELSGLYERQQSMTFETFDPKRATALEAPERREALAQAQDAFDYCRAFADEPRGWIVLIGPKGTGKTHLAASIANARLAQGQPVLFMVSPELLNWLREACRPDAPEPAGNRLREIMDAPLLILDDLGTENLTAWAAEQLYLIINHRYNRLLPTVFTTNLTAAELERGLGSRIASRMMHGAAYVGGFCRLLLLTGLDQRPEQLETKAVRKT